jgi:LEA14-like dessication related protein
MIPFLPFGLLPLCTGALPAGCGMLLKDPEITVKGAVPAAVSLSGITLDVTLQVDNPNPVGITLKSVAFDLFYKSGGRWEFLASGRQGAKSAIRPGKSDITIPVSAKNAEIVKAVIGMVTTGSIDIRIDGKAAVDLKILAPEVPFTKEMNIPLQAG